VVEASRQLSPAQALVPEIVRCAMAADESTNSDVLSVYSGEASIVYHRMLDEVAPGSREVFAALLSAETIELRTIRATTGLDERAFYVALYLLRTIEFVDAKWAPTPKGHRALNPDYKMPESPRPLPQARLELSVTSEALLRCLASKRRRTLQTDLAVDVADFFPAHERRSISRPTLREHIQPLIVRGYVDWEQRRGAPVKGYRITPAGLEAAKRLES
jgi:hypothetical protein